MPKCALGLMVKVPNRERHGGNRRIECRRDPGCRSYRQESFQVFTRESGRAAESAGNTSTDLHSWSFTTKRRTGADLQNANEKLSHCVAKRNATAFDRVGNFHLWNAASARAGNDVL